MVNIYRVFTIQRGHASLQKGLAAINSTIDKIMPIQNPPSAGRGNFFDLAIYFIYQKRISLAFP